MSVLTYSFIRIYEACFMYFSLINAKSFKSFLGYYFDGAPITLEIDYAFYPPTTYVLLCMRISSRLCGFIRL